MPGLYSGDMETNRTTTRRPYELNQADRVARVSECIDILTPSEAAPVWKLAQQLHTEQDDNSISFLRALEQACAQTYPDLFHV